LLASGTESSVALTMFSHDRHQEVTAYLPLGHERVLPATTPT